MLESNKLTRSNKKRWEDFASFLISRPKKRIERVERIFPQGMHIMYSLYGSKPLKISELSDLHKHQDGFSETAIKSKRDQTLILLEQEGDYKSQAKIAAKNLLKEYKRRERLTFVLRQNKRKLCLLELQVALIMLRSGAFGERVKEAIGLSENQANTIMQKLIDTNDSRFNVPGPEYRISILRTLRRKNAINAKAQLEAKILKLYREKKNSSAIGEVIGASQSAITTLLQETKRDIASCELFAGELAGLEAQASKVKENSRKRVCWLHQNLFDLHTRFRQAHPFTEREERYISLRLSGKSEKECAKSLGIRTQSMSIFERALIGVFTPREKPVFPEVLPLAPFTSAQKAWIESVDYKGPKLWLKAK